MKDKRVAVYILVPLLIPVIAGIVFYGLAFLSARGDYSDYDQSSWVFEAGCLAIIFFPVMVGLVRGFIDGYNSCLGKSSGRDHLGMSR